MTEFSTTAGRWPSTLSGSAATAARSARAAPSAAAAAESGGGRRPLKDCVRVQVVAQRLRAEEERDAETISAQSESGWRTES